MDGLELVTGSNDNKLEQLAQYVSALEKSSGDEQPLYNGAAQILPITDFMGAAEPMPLIRAPAGVGAFEFYFMLSGEASHIVLAESSANESKVEIFNTDKARYTVVVTYSNGNRQGFNVIIFAGAEFHLRLSDGSNLGLGGWLGSLSGTSIEESPSYGGQWTSTTAIYYDFIMYHAGEAGILDLDTFYFGGGMSLNKIKVTGQQQIFGAADLIDGAFTSGNNVYTVAGDTAAIEFNGA